MAATKSTADNMGRLCLWAVSHALRRKSALSAVLVTMVLKIGLDVLRPWPMKVLVDYALKADSAIQSVGALAWLPGGPTPQNLISWCVASTVVLFLLGWLLGLATSYANISFAQRMVYDLATELFGHLQRLSLRFHSRKPVGDSIRRVTSDCGCVATIVRDALLPVLTSVISLAVMFSVMWQLDPLLTLLALAVAPGMIVVFRRYARPMLERSYEQQETDARMYNVVEQTLSAMPVVQAFTREEQADRQFQKSCADTLRAALATTSVQLWFKGLMGLMTALGTAAVIWVGGHHVLTGQLSVGSVLVFLSYLGSLYAPLESFMYLTSTVQSAGGSARRVLEVLETDHEVADRPGAAALPPVKGYIRLENVNFGYSPERAVLHDISLEVFPGQTLALVGATGAGKSTLASLLPRFFDPWEGRVLVDGHDIRDVQLRSLRDQIAIVLQEPFLFPMTIGENIAYGRPGATRTEIESAARAANAHDFIVRLPQAYDTPVGSRGATLSGGERQRLSIARAFLKNAPILILDEPTSSLDAETELLLLEALRRLMKNRTTLIIAHRLTTVRNADQIAVLQEGRIVESGTHDELVLLPGVYAHLYTVQLATPAVSLNTGQEGS